MITSELSGGIGNQLFQISAAISLAESNDDNTSFIFNDIDDYDNIFKNLNKDVFVIEHEYKEPFFNFYKIPYKNNLKLFGQFQSDKYFFEHKELIIDLFKANDNIKEKVNDYISYNKKTNKNTVSLHVKLESDKYRDFVGMDYIKKCLNVFNDDTIYILSDDIEWCKKNIKNNFNELVFIDDLNKYELFYLMSLTSHNIISNSTFSWWGSYLNTNPEKIILAPKNWFNKNFEENFLDVYHKKILIT